MLILWISLALIFGVLIGVVFSGKISKALKSLETTIDAKLTAIETAVKAQVVHTNLTVGSALKSHEDYVEEIAAKVFAKLKAAETTIAAKL